MNDIYKKIKDDIENNPVPENLNPENIDAILSSAPSGKETDSGNVSFESGDRSTAQSISQKTVDFSKKKKVRKWLSVGMPLAATAAVAALVIVNLPAGEKGKNTPSKNPTALNLPDKTIVTGRKDAGKLYHVASSDQEIKDYLKKNYRSRVKDYFAYESGGVDESTSEKTTGSTSDSPVQEDSDTGSDYTGTNLQVFGVDESDTIKTDGKYIYTVNSDGNIHITSVSGEDMKTASVIEAPEGDDDYGEFSEIYLQDDRLLAICEVSKVSIDYTDFFRPSAKDYIVDEDYIVDTDEPYYDFNDNNFVYVYTYDVSNPKKPKLLAEYEQQGGYKTSRLTDGMLYLFTDRYITNEKDFPSTVMGKTLDSSSIYLPRDPGYSQLIVSSMNVDNPGQNVDAISIVNDAEIIYMTKNSFYISTTNYSSFDYRTDIARFEMNEGVFNASGASYVKGTVRDEFSLHEGDGFFSVLSTNRDENGSKNNLTTFDLSMKKTGRIRNIAPGEQIYGARYLGDYAYFITFRNMDPLFIADLSDPSAPKITGSVDITGFSDYLHPWTKDRLLGIGYEADPVDGTRSGVKLVMFDTTDPTDPQVIGTYTIPNADFPGGVYYKDVLADAKKNVIGFSTHDMYGNAEYGTAIYNTFSWDDDQNAFVPTHKQTMKNAYSPNYARGLMINDILYVIDQVSIVTSNGTTYQFTYE